MNLSSEELVRYQRHLSLAGFGPGAQARLKNGRVLVIGAGGLGSPALLYLTAAGVGHITLIDPDVVEISNLQRQVLYTDDDAGQPKAAVAARRLGALNPLVKVSPLATRFTRDNALALVGAHDVVVDGSDNFTTRYLANDACVLAGRPLVYGAIQGFEGQASVFNWHDGPTYRCLFPEPPAPGLAPDCAEAGVIGILPGLIGTIQATETIKLLTGIGEPLSGRLLLWNALDMTMRTVRFAADPASHRLTGLPPEDYGETCGVPVESAPDETSAEELRTRFVSLQLIDVREVWERSVGAIEPSAHVPLGRLQTDTARAALAALDPQRPTVVYCAVGVRSLRALPVLRAQHGFSSVTSLRGGYRAWNHASG